MYFPSVVFGYDPKELLKIIHAITGLRGLQKRKNQAPTSVIAHHMEGRVRGGASASCPQVMSSQCLQA